MTALNIRHFTLSAVILSVLCSCNRWLEPESEVTPDRNTLLETPAGIEDAFTGIYASMSHKDLYGRALTYYIPSILAGHYGMVGTDIEHWMKYPYDRGGGNYNESAVIDIDRIWSRMYNLIANVNSIIAYTETADPDERNEALCHAKGEALALRGFLHFEVLRYFGRPYTTDADSPAIPYMDRLSSSANPILSGRQVVGRIIADLEHSVALMNGCVDGNKLRFGRVAALATMSRVHLYAGNLHEAHEYAMRAMAERPASVEWNTSADDRLFNSELIFALNVSRMDEYAAGWLLPGGIGRKNTIMVLTSAGEYYFDEPGDIRGHLWVALIGNDRYCVKFDLNDPFPLMPVIRLSEMAYIAAETAPDHTEAISHLNTVRTCRGLAPLPDDVTVNIDEELAKEYRREFLCEGQLWHYYKRKLYVAIPGNSYFHGRTDLYTFPLPEDENIFGNISK